MKPSSKSILDWLTNTEIEQMCDLMFKNSAGFSESELSIEEANEIFNFLRDTLNKLIEKDILDKSSFNKRNMIFTQLTNISNSIKQIAQYNYNLNRVRNIGKNIFLYIMTLHETVEIIQITYKNVPFYDYNQETKDLSRIKKEYNKLLKDVELIEKNKEQSNKSINEISKKISELGIKAKELQDNISTASNLNTKVNSLYTKISNTSLDIENKKLTINSLHKTAKELETIITNSNSNISQSIENSKVDINSFVTEIKTNHEKFVTDFQNDNKKIQNKNLELQKKINQLLEGANAGRLHKSFNLRKRQLEKNQNWWFTGIVIVNLAIVVFTLLIVNGSESIGIKPLNPNQLDSAFYIKLFISIPLIFLDWFVIQQYTQRKDLIEKYSFKSVLALSLLAYNEMIIDNQENDNSIDFIKKTVEKIYESPFENKHISKKELETLNKLAEKGLDQLNDIAKNTIDKVAG